MPNNCIIAGCTHREGKHGVLMYRIPVIRRRKDGSIKELTERRQRLWLAAINREGFDKERDLKSSHRVCSRHFVKGKPSSVWDETDPDWVPSLNLGHELEMIEPKEFIRFSDRNERNATMKAASALVQLASVSNLIETEIVAPKRPI